MDEIITCPHCLNDLKFGDGYTSLEIHTDGFGFSNEFPIAFNIEHNSRCSDNNDLLFFGSRPRRCP